MTDRRYTNPRTGEITDDPNIRPFDQIRDGSLSLGVKLAEPDKAIEDAFAGIVTQAQDGLPVRVNNGRP